MNKKPNIILFNPDQMRADSMFHLGNKAAHTPNFDHLAYDGISFSNAYCQNPVCTPSRASFMSGWYPHVRGHRTISYLMHEDEPVLLKQLKEIGYHVWSNGRNDLIAPTGKKPYRNYLSEYFTPKGKIDNTQGDKLTTDINDDNFYSFYQGLIDESKKEGKDIDTLWVEGAIKFIQDYDGKKPFMMFLPLMNPHPPYQVEKKYYDLINESKIPERVKPPKNYEGKASILKGLAELQNLKGWDEDRWTELRKVYLGQVAKVDDLFGQLMKALKDKGLYDDTMVFMFSDHGDYTGDFGIVEKTQNTFEDCLTNVPFIVKPPKSYKCDNGINHTMVELIDFYATVKEVANIGYTHTQFGKSLVPILKGKESENRKYVFSEGGRLKQEIHCSESYGNESLIDKTNHYYPRMVMQKSQGPEHTKAIMCRDKNFKYVKRLDEHDEFYDLNIDPKEINNLIQDNKYKNKIDEMKEVMFDWLHETADVVPVKQDIRFDKKMLLTFMKSRIPKMQYYIVKTLLDLNIVTPQKLMERAMKTKNEQ